MKYEYIKQLMIQFAKSQGYSNIDLNDSNFRNEFEDWLIKMQAIGRDYLTFVEFLNVNPQIDEYNTAEVNKGPYDSVVLGTNYEIITDNFDGALFNNFRFVTPGKFNVINAKPYIAHFNYNQLSEHMDITRFITQNPYNIDMLNGWNDLHNSGNYNIAVGVYGSIYDKDIDIKTKQIQALANTLDNEIVLDKEIDNGSYYMAVASSREILTRNKLR